MPSKPSPRNLPTSSKRAGTFTPRRSYARARASRERVEALARIERNKRSQAAFTRNLKLTINLSCIAAIIGLLFYILFLSPDPEKDPINEQVEESEASN